MLELICHHTYRWGGLAADLSPYGCHGASADTGAQDDGVGVGSGAATFRRLQSAIRIPPGRAWAPLGALKIEVTLRVDVAGGFGPAGAFRQVIEADSAFLLTITPFGIVEATVGPSAAGESLTSDAAFAPDGIDHVLPANQWTQIGLLWDGEGSAELSIDGAVVGARHDLELAAPGVAAGGVVIGNWLLGSMPLLGAIDEIKIWRRDPRELRRNFLARPIDRTTADCWERLARAVFAYGARNPDCAHRLRTSLAGAIDRLRRAMLAAPGGRERYAELCERYARHWRAGELGDPGAAGVVAEISRFLRELGLDGDADPDLRSLLASECWRELVARLPGLPCDPAILAFIDAAAAGGDARGQ